MSEDDGVYNVLSLFAGIGGICDGFSRTGRFHIAVANEIDNNACKTYKFNHPDTNLIEDDICNIHASDFECRIDVVAGGFPCQPFSNAGRGEGFQDPQGRGLMFFQIMRLVDELTEAGNRPKALFFENVSRLKTIDNGNTLRRIKNEIISRGYSLVEPFILNSRQYGGVPQTRNRIYIVAFDSEEARNKFKIPSEIPMRPLNSIIHIDERKDDIYYYIPGSSKYYDVFNSEIREFFKIYQFRRYYMRENKTGVCPTLTANMGTGGHNVPLIRDKFGIRRLTVEECLELQGFDTDGPYAFRFPEIALGQRYKQIGNSVTVPVIKAIADRMANAMDPPK